MVVAAEENQRVEVSLATEIKHLLEFAALGLRSSAPPVSQKGSLPIRDRLKTQLVVDY